MTYVTYKYFNKSNQRLAIFGEVINDNMAITIIPCSKKDQFNKKKARELYNKIKEGETVHYEAFNFKGTDASDFFRWCKSRYYKKVYIITDENTEIVKYTHKTGKKPSRIEILYSPQINKEKVS
jgi:hypothetical protein